MGKKTATELEHYIYKEKYTIDGEEYVAVANFLNNRLKVFRVSSGGFNEEYSLNEYTSFNGNMEDFVKNKVIK